MKTFDTFYDKLLPELPGCTINMVDHHLREVAREFCEVTSIWRGAFEPLSAKAGQAIYFLDGPETDSEVVKITKLAIADQLLWIDAEERPDPLRDEREDERRPKYRRNEPPFTINADINELTLRASEVPKSAMSKAVKVSGVLRPSRNAKRLPDFLLVKYSEAMRHGTLSRLMMMGNKPWTDRELATVYMRSWQQDKFFSAHMASTGNTNGKVRTRKAGV